MSASLDKSVDTSQWSIIAMNGSTSGHTGYSLPIVYDAKTHRICAYSVNRQPNMLWTPAEEIDKLVESKRITKLDSPIPFPTENAEHQPVLAWFSEFAWDYITNFVLEFTYEHQRVLHKYPRAGYPYEVDFCFFEKLITDFSNEEPIIFTTKNQIERLYAVVSECIDEDFKQILVIPPIVEKYLEAFRLIARTFHSRPEDERKELTNGLRSYLRKFQYVMQVDSGTAKLKEISDEILSIFQEELQPEKHKGSVRQVLWNINNEFQNNSAVEIMDVEAYIQKLEYFLEQRINIFNIAQLGVQSSRDTDTNYRASINELVALCLWKKEVAYQYYRLCVRVVHKVEPLKVIEDMNQISGVAAAELMQQLDRLAAQKAAA